MLFHFLGGSDLPATYKRCQQLVKRELQYRRYEAHSMYSDMLRKLMYLFLLIFFWKECRGGGCVEGAKDETTFLATHFGVYLLILCPGRKYAVCPKMFKQHISLNYSIFIKNFRIQTFE